MNTRARRAAACPRRSPRGGRRRRGAGARCSAPASPPATPTCSPPRSTTGLHEPFRAPDAPLLAELRADRSPGQRASRSRAPARRSSSGPRGPTPAGSPSSTTRASRGTVLSLAIAATGAAHDEGPPMSIYEQPSDPGQAAQRRADRRRRPRPRARDAEGRRLHRRGPREAARRRRDDLDRDDAVQLQPARARQAREGRHPRRRRHADRVQHDLRLRRRLDGDDRHARLADLARGDRRLDRARRARATSSTASSASSAATRRSRPP